MREPVKAFGPDDRGGAALQFAFILPAMVALLMGALQLGMALYSGAAVRSAVQRSARLLISDPATTDAQLQTAVRAAVANVPVQDITVSSTRETVGTNDTMARVAWTYSYMIQVPLLPQTTFNFNSNVVVPVNITN